MTASLGDERLRPLVVTQVVMSAADAAFTVSLAGSLFFAVSVDAARPRVLVYLLCTLAPFAVVGPLVGPLVDRLRGGHRAALLLSAVGRAVACVVLAGNLSTLLFIPVAFTVLVLAKSAAVARSVLLPRLVDDVDGLVSANARITRFASLGGLAGGVVGAGVYRLAGPQLVVVVAAAGYAATALLGWHVPRLAVASSGSGVVESVQLAGPLLGLAAAGMSMIRFASGFMTFHVALALKTSNAPAWVFGLVLLAGTGAALVASIAGPLLRRGVSEEMLLAGALTALAACCLLAAGQRPRSGAVLVAAVFGLAGAVGHQAFTSTAQRLAPDAALGRAFARFDARFQIVWAVGAVGPVLADLSWPLGFGILGAALAVTVLAYDRFRRSLRSQPVQHAAATGDDPVTALLALAHVLAARGDANLAVSVATDAARIVSTRRRAGAPLPPELMRLWLGVARGGTTSAVDAARALAIVEHLAGLEPTRPLGHEPAT